MPVKAVPVEAAEEAGEPPKPAPEEPVAAETKKEEVPEKPAPKAKSRAKASAAKLRAAEGGKAKPLGPKAAEKAAEKAQVASDKAAEKAKKEQEKVDMKARVKCPVCHRTVSQHCLLYTHKCSQAALDKKPKPPTVEEKFETKEVEPEPPEEEPVAPKKAVRAPKKVVRYMPGDSDEEPVTGPGAPKSFSDRLYERGDEEFLGYPKARVPPPPPLVRQQVYQPTYREQLIMRQRERQHQQALSQVAPIRRLFKR